MRRPWSHLSTLHDFASVVAGPDAPDVKALADDELLYEDVFVDDPDSHRCNKATLETIPCHVALLASRYNRKHRLQP